VGGLTGLENRVIEAIDATQLVTDLRELVAIASIDGSPGERDAQQWCAHRLADRGLDVETWEIDIPALGRQPDFPGMEVDRLEALGCVATLGPTDPEPALAFCGHTDVVPAGPVELWPNHDPFAVVVDKVGRAWGRGTCDMKAGVVACIAAISAIADSGVTLSRPLAMHCVSAEEDGGLGAYAMLRRGHRAAACVIAEPTSGDVIPANAGALTFRLEVSGRATHGSTRTRGVSAIDKFGLVQEALRRLEEQRNRDAPPLFAHLDLAWPLSVGIIAAGSWASTVPDQLVAEGRYGVRIDETLTEAITAFQAAINEVCVADSWLRQHPVAVSWPGGRFAPGSLPAGHRLLGDVVRTVADVTGRLPSAVGGPYGSDLRHYAAAGVPALQYGPGDVRFAHAVDEHVELADVEACARVYAVLALRACGVDGTEPAMH
jgi:acetylornithine deacetylase